jgi:hypothetical protein
MAREYMMAKFQQIGRKTTQIELNSPGHGHELLKLGGGAEKRLGSERFRVIAELRNRQLQSSQSNAAVYSTMH